MIKLCFLLRRLPQLSLESFQKYWRETHGPLVRKHARILRIARYVQVHTIEHPLTEALRASRAEIDPYDGAAELWWKDREDFAAVLGDSRAAPALAELLEDERRFIDHSRSCLWIARERVFIPGPQVAVVAEAKGPITKVLFAFRRLPALSLEQCQTYWREHHGELVRRNAPDFPILRYAQAHRIDDPLNEVLRASRGAGEPYDGIAEIWGDLESLVAASATPAGQRAAEQFLEDERRFIDPARSSIWLGKENVVIGE